MEETAQIEGTPDAMQHGPEGNEKSGMQIPKIHMPAFKIPKFNKKMLFILALIFILGFAIRGHQLQYELFFEFDTYWHARMTSYAIKGELIPVFAPENIGKSSIIDMKYCETGADSCSYPPKDPLAYYQIGGARIPSDPMGFWFINAAIYKIFTFGSAYNKEVWIQFVKVLPAIYGALTALAMFFLFRRIYRSNKAGYLAGFFTAASSAFVYRTMAGWYEGSSMVFLFMVLGFFLFARATGTLELKRKNLLNAVAAGIVLSISPWIGGWFLIIPYLLIAYGIYNLIIMWLRGIEAQEIKTFAVLLFAIANAAGILFIISSWMGDWLRIISYFLIMGWFFIIIYLLFKYGIYNLITKLRVRGIEAQKIKAFAVLFVVMFAIFAGLMTLHIGIGWTSGAFSYLYKFFPNLAPVSGGTGEITGGDVLAATVGEQNTGYQFFGTKFSALIIFPILALILIPIRIFRKRNDVMSLLLFFWILATFIMAWNRLQLTFAFGLAVAAAAAFVCFDLLEFFEKRKTAEKVAVAAFVGFMLITAVGSSIFFISDHFPPIELAQGWKTALKWASINTEKDAKFYNWWDEGHWVTFLGERGASTDNRNYDFAGDRDFALFIVEEDENKMHDLVKSYGADYVILDEDLLMKQRSLGMYAYVTTNGNDERIAKFFGVAFGCSILQLTQEIECGPNKIPLAQYQSLPTAWTDIPNQVQDRMPLFIYRDNDFTRLYIVNSATNSSLLARLWFRAPDITHFEEIYYAKGIKIIRVK
ncbi:MAG: hypothetical protein HYW05_05320 [Candidatus Diapherotrites archaeon]|nr:hypothetical protein [Candidatus Diapherotrites archaeon]